MTTYTAHPDEIFDVGKPNIGATHLQARDNLLSALEGDDTAPHAALKAIERVAAGDTIRASLPDTTVDSSSPATYSFGFLQIGTVKVTGTAATGTQVGVSRWRNAVETSLFASGSATTLDIASVDVLPGDTISVVWSTGSGTGRIVTAQIKTDGGNLWCANPSENTGVTGNDV